MRGAFEEAEVGAADIERLEPEMTNDPKDRHVLAAAVAAGSELIVTFNLDDFPAPACEPLGVAAIHPDDFLLNLHGLYPGNVRAALEQQAADLNPPWSLDQSLDALEIAGALAARSQLSICRTIALANDRACTPLPHLNFHGKDGVDGSSPSEGFAKCLQIAISRACLDNDCHARALAGTP
jgi:hypothetical protein